MKHTKVLGTIEGRHPLPVDQYILESVSDPTDVSGIRDAVDTSMTSLTADGTKAIDLYVTGLTIVSLLVIDWCALHDVTVTCWHYNAATGEYFPQEMLSTKR